MEVSLPAFWVTFAKAFLPKINILNLPKSLKYAHYTLNKTGNAENKVKLL